MRNVVEGVLGLWGYLHPNNVSGHVLMLSSTKECGDRQGIVYEGKGLIAGSVAASTSTNREIIQTV